MKTDSIEIVTISAVGDLMCHSPQFQSAQIAKDSFDFRSVYSEIKSYLSSADITIGNLETTISDKGNYSGYPAFKSPKQYLEALKDTGFDFLFTSNNHSLDKGEQGILNTITFANEFGLQSTGTFNSTRYRDSVRLVNVNGIKIALLSYSYGTNGRPIPKGKNYLINLIDTTLICDDITRAESLSPDLVVVYFHFGEEYQREPNSFQKMITEKTIEFGADIILASHPHVIQPVSFFKATSGRIDSGFIAYSLGNFISNQQWRYSDAGVILNFTVLRDLKNNNLKLGEIKFLPTWVYKGNIDDILQYKILPSECGFSDSLYSYLSANDRMRMKESYLDTKSILTKYSSRPKLVNIPEVKELIEMLRVFAF
ncbi:MAG: CapA family protein [bacterium]